MVRVPADERRERLAEAAVRVMVRDGVAGMTTRSVVAEAEMPLGAFHYCFRSKQELLEEVITTMTAHNLDRALTSVRAQGTVEERLRAGLGVYWDHVVDHPGEHRVTYELTQYAAHRPALEHLTRRQYETYLAAFVTVLETLAEAAGIRWSQPVMTLARYLTAMVDGLTLLYLNEGDDGSAREVLDLAAAHLAGLACRSA